MSRAPGASTVPASSSSALEANAREAMKASTPAAPRPMRTSRRTWCFPLRCQARGRGARGAGGDDLRQAREDLARERTAAFVAASLFRMRIAESVVVDQDARALHVLDHPGRERGQLHAGVA